MQGFPWKTGCPAFAPVGPGRAGPNTPDATRPVTVIGHMRQDLGQISPVCEGLPFKRSTKNQKENKQNAQKLSIPFGLFANRIYKAILLSDGLLQAGSLFAKSWQSQRRVLSSVSKPQSVNLSCSKLAPNRSSA